MDFLLLAYLSSHVCVGIFKEKNENIYEDPEILYVDTRNSNAPQFNGISNLGNSNFFCEHISKPNVCDLKAKNESYKSNPDRKSTNLLFLDLKENRRAHKNKNKKKLCKTKKYDVLKNTTRVDFDGSYESYYKIEQDITANQCNEPVKLEMNSLSKSYNNFKKIFRICLLKIRMNYDLINEQNYVDKAFKVANDKKSIKREIRKKQMPDEEEQGCCIIKKILENENARKNRFVCNTEQDTIKRYGNPKLDNIISKMEKNILESMIKTSNNKLKNDENKKSDFSNEYRGLNF